MDYLTRTSRAELCVSPTPSPWIVSLSRSRKSGWYRCGAAAVSVLFSWRLRPHGEAKQKIGSERLMKSKQILSLRRMYVGLRRNEYLMPSLVGKITAKLFRWFMMDNCNTYRALSRVADDISSFLFLSYQVEIWLHLYQFCRVFLGKGLTYRRYYYVTSSIYYNLFKLFI